MWQVINCHPNSITAVVFAALWLRPSINDTSVLTKGHKVHYIFFLNITYACRGNYRFELMVRLFNVIQEEKQDISSSNHCLQTLDNFG